MGWGLLGWLVGWLWACGFVGLLGAGLVLGA